MLTQQTIDCAIAALEVAHDSLSEPSAHFAVEIQRQHQAEIVAALAELAALREGTAEPAPQPERAHRWRPVRQMIFASPVSSNSLRLIDDDTLYMSDGATEIVIRLPDDYRLCRRITPATAAVEMGGAA